MSNKKQKMTKKICIFTDVKVDDIVAILALIETDPTAHYSIVISDVNDLGKADAFLERVINLRSGNGNRFTFDTYSGIQSLKEKSHETMFTVPSHGVVPTKLPEYNENFTGFDSVICLCPMMPIFMKYFSYFTNTNIFIGLGYNTNTEIDGKTAPNYLMAIMLRSFASTSLGSKLYVMNNVMSWDEKSKSMGGRVTYDDELWTKLEKTYSGFKSLVLEKARNDSIAFIERQMKKQGCEADIKSMLKEENYDQVLKILNEMPEWPKHKQSYKGRIKDQLERKTIDIELTDAKQVMCFLTEKENAVTVDLEDAGKFVTWRAFNTENGMNSSVFAFENISSEKIMGQLRNLF